MIIDIYQDTICPWCRIGKHNLFTALAQYKHDEEITIRWHAFQLDPNIRPEGEDFKQVMLHKMGGPERLQQVFNHLLEAGKAYGVNFNMDRVTHTPNTKLSHQLIALAPASKQKQVIDAIFTAYFENGVNLGDLDALMRIAEEVGLPNLTELRTQLDEGVALDEVEADQHTAQEVGITGVPFFIFNEKYSVSGGQPPENFLKVLERASE